MNALLLIVGGLVAQGFLSRSKVLLRERAAGVDPRLQALLDQWEASGPFDVVVAPDGGVRTDAAKQAAYARSGVSQAATLDQTPHGRGGAVDLWPANFDPRKPVDAAMYQRFLAIGTFAEMRALRWGGRWVETFGPSAQNPYGGDLPHIELRDWRTLPYPPRGVA